MTPMNNVVRICWKCS